MSQGNRKVGLDAVGITRTASEHWNLGTAALYEEALRRKEGELSKDGALVCSTGRYTGRSPNDKFVVKEASSEKNIDWGKVNKPIDPAKFDALHTRMAAYAADKDLFVLDAYCGADPAYRLPVRVITEMAWHNLFVRNMFIPELDQAKQLAHEPGFTVIDIPSFKADPATDGTLSETFIIVNLAKKLVLIGGTQYAGDLLVHELPLAASRHDAEALLGQRRRRRRRRAVLRPLGHGQDDALERHQPRAHRRRRARLERERRLQLRRRLLREDDQALGRSRAADLRDDPALWHSPRERRGGSADAMRENIPANADGVHDFVIDGVRFHEPHR